MADPTTRQSKKAASRLEICETCEFKKVVNLAGAEMKQCSKCGCFLAAKVFVPYKEACPEKKWVE